MKKAGKIEDFSVANSTLEDVFLIFSKMQTNID